MAQRREPNFLQRLLARLLGRPDRPPVTLEAQREAMSRILAQFERDSTALARGLAQGRIDLDTWQSLMQQEIRRHHLAASLAGNGGVDPSEAVRVGQQRASEQIAYLNKWADEMRDGSFPVDAEARIRQRAKLYGGAGNATFSDGRAASFGVTLPQRPGDGRTVCLTNCKCALDFEEDDAEVRVYWRLGVAEHCPDCVGMAARWNPLRLPKQQ